jgi:uncharacterized protein YndB with AHSA1/START domain
VIELPCEAEINCSAECIFDLITDIRGQSRWLPHSPSFRGTADLSANPVTLGTTYREPSAFGTRHGTVTEYTRPTTITFHQPMTMALHTGTVDITMRYTLAPNGSITHVRRVVTIAIPPQLRPLQPIITYSFRTESRRTLLALKAYADTLTDGP